MFFAEMARDTLALETMPKLTYRFCRRCGRSREEVGPLSHTRLCGDCAEELLIANVDGIHFHRGPAFQRWRRGMAACIGLSLLDDAQETE